MTQTELAPIDLAGLDRFLRESAERPVRALLLYGSMVEGLANSASDIDVVAIGDGERAMQILVWQGRHVHLEYHAEADLRAGIAGIEAALGQRQLDLNLLACRLASAVVLHDVDGAGAAIVELAGAYRPSPSLIGKFLNQSFGLYHDAVGAYRAGDYTHALALTRLSLQIFTVARLLERGTTLLSLKWQQAVARREFGDDPQFWPTYCAILGLADDEAAKAKAQSAMSSMRSMLRDAKGAADASAG